MKLEDKVVAKVEGNVFTAHEIARVLGEPRDPRTEYDPIVEMLCITDTATADEDVYYHTNAIPTDKVITITSTGYVTQEANSLISPTQFSFIDMASNEEYVKLIDIAKRKENIMARVNKSVTDGLNNWEIYHLLGLLATAASSTGQQVSLDSGETAFNYSHVVEMLQQVAIYGDNFLLFMGTTVYQDYLLWNWTDNKNQDLFAQFRRLNIKPVRCPAYSVTVDTVAKTVMTPTKAYLVALNSNSAAGSKPAICVRRELDEVAGLMGVQAVGGGTPQRIILTTGNPVAVGASNQRMLAIGVTGWEEVAMGVVNPYAISEFTRA